jgi:hypothetical protein
MPLFARARIEDDLLPVAPADDWTYPAPAPSTYWSVAPQRALKTPVMAAGDWSVLIEVVAKKPTTRSPAAVVVTDGAWNERLLVVNAPLCESTGLVVETPLKSRIAPPTGAVAPSVQR